MTAVLCKRFLVITLLLGVSLVELVSARVLKEREAHCEADLDIIAPSIHELVTTATISDFESNRTSPTLAVNPSSTTIHYTSQSPSPSAAAEGDRGISSTSTSTSANIVQAAQQQQSFKMKTVLVLKVNKINALALESGFIHEAVANALSLPTGTVIYNTGTVTCTNLDQISSKLNKIRINNANNKNKNNKNKETWDSKETEETVRLIVAIEIEISARQVPDLFKNHYFLYEQFFMDELRSETFATALKAQSPEGSRSHIVTFESVELYNGNVNLPPRQPTDHTRAGNHSYSKWFTMGNKWWVMGISAIINLMFLTSTLLYYYAKVNEKVIVMTEVEGSVDHNAFEI